jgi:hypothetical protein
VERSGHRYNEPPESIHHHHDERHHDRESHCGHTDVVVVARTFREPNPGRGSIVMVENVGNRVWRALFDLAERTFRCGVKTGRRKLICSALEMKVVDKIGLLPDVEFDRARAAAQARQVNPDIVIVPLSAPTGCLLPPASPPLARGTSSVYCFYWGKCLGDLFSQVERAPPAPTAHPSRRATDSPVYRRALTGKDRRLHRAAGSVPAVRSPEFGAGDHAHNCAGHPAGGRVSGGFARLLPGWISGAAGEHARCPASPPHAS